MNNHSAAWCFNRYDEKYMGKRPADQNVKPTAYIASPDTVMDQAWYADSGASHHVTNDKNNVAEAREYGGKEKMTVGNGTALSIAHIGYKSFDVGSKKGLVLEKLLHVPRIKKNLISVSKLTADNDVSVEFFPNDCVVNDLSSRKALLQGKLKGGLYQLNLTNHNTRPLESIRAYYHQFNNAHTLLNTTLNQSTRLSAEKILESECRT